MSTSASIREPMPIMHSATPT